MAYLGTHIWWLEGFEAWRRTKIEVKLNINEKIKRVLGGWAVGSRIQDIDFRLSPESLKQYPR
jgi:hypothetical protein